MGLKVAVLGATGAVGAEVVRILQERRFPVDELRLLASERSAGKTLKYAGSDVAVQAVSRSLFKGMDIAFFAAGGGVSLEWAPQAAAEGCVVIDKTSAYREDPDIPLIVPEVNPHHLPMYRRKGIISSPNCSTIPMVLVLKPLNDVAKVKRVVVSTYQSVSGAGAAAMMEMETQSSDYLSGSELKRKKFLHRIAFNLIPHIDSFLPDGYTKEEQKMISETRKIMDLPNLPVSPTTVRVPVLIGHSESINVETESELTAAAARAVLSKAPGVKIIDDPNRNLYPMPVDCAGKDETFVGRLRDDPSVKFGINLWLCCDNLRKGAALNAVQIAELFASGGK